MSELTGVVRAVIRAALDGSPDLLPRDRHVGLAALEAAKDRVADELARELVGNGWLPFEASDLRTKPNYHAVSYTMGQMRRRLLKHIRGSGRDVEAEREAMESIAAAFFSDLEERGWCLVRAREPGPRNYNPGFPGPRGIGGG